MTWISLLTDYGVQDPFVAICHGVIARIAPQSRVIDVTHAIPPGDIRRGATVLAQALPYLPAGIHVAIVDPGVGTTRRAIAVRTGEHVLIGPDNGLLLPAAETVGGIRDAFELTNETLWLHPVSATFHGRDIFCPTAAHLANGFPISDVGLELQPDDLVRLPSPFAHLDDGRLDVEILSIDHFGNVQLACRDVPWTAGTRLRIEGRDSRLEAMRGTTFGSVPEGQAVVLVDSAGFVAVAIHRGSAAEALRVAEGDRLTIRPAV
ncbi:MAG: SAM-dependent chlorinase/fluorinase [Acidothermus sp.]|nr:SAM-dependent chlorinase/fluorinase [Acidothermus sp.]